MQKNERGSEATSGSTNFKLQTKNYLPLLSLREKATFLFS
jgi:hypothetical protein